MFCSVVQAGASGNGAKRRPLIEVGAPQSRSKPSVTRSALQHSILESTFGCAALRTKHVLVTERSVGRTISTGQRQTRRIHAYSSLWLTIVGSGDWGAGHAGRRGGVHRGRGDDDGGEEGDKEEEEEEEEAGGAEGVC